MKKFFTLLSLASAITATPFAMAEPATAYCTLSWQNSEKKTIDGPCQFKQDQVNIFIDNFNDYRFGFPISHPSAKFQQKNKKEIVSFQRKGHYILRIYREKP